MAHPRHGASFDRRVGSGGDNGGYISGKCSDHSLIASHSCPNFFFVSFWMLESLVLSFFFKYTNSSFQ